jgi:uncharacterized protein (DUF1697 family)
VNTYVVLLRGINVGGKNLLPMAQLKALLQSSGFSNVKTYIQSGNVVLKNSEPPALSIEKLIHTEFGFCPEVLALSESQFKLSFENNPYSGFEGKFVHVYYCKTPPKIDQTKLDKFVAMTENYSLVGKVFYLHAPDGIGRSKLVANIESCLGVSATGRNLNTVSKLREMVDDV